MKRKKKPNYEVTVPLLHSGQEAVVAQFKRFNVIRCGRRFGKTTLAIRLLTQAAIGPYGEDTVGIPVAYFAPTYKMLNKQWLAISKILKPITARKDTQLKQIELITGGRVDFWSLENPDSVRGDAYGFIFVDEAAMIRDLKDTIEQVLLPLLTDLEGSACFGSTPRGENDFYIIDQFSLTQPDWASFHLPTSANPFIKPRELARMQALLPADVWNQEYEAEYVSFDGKTFLQYFKVSVHVSPVLYEPQYDLFLSFDFNIANTCLVIQNVDEELWVLKEYHSELYDLETLCQQIELDFPDASFTINGDAAGHSGSATSTNNSSAYELIHQYMNLDWEQFTVPRSNPSHLNSYMWCNYVFKNFVVRIHPECVGLITDLKKVKVQRVKNKFEIIKTDPKLTHHLDPLRYHIAAHWYDRMPEINALLDGKRVVEEDTDDWD